MTEDGSHTLWDPVLNETYHSRKGAVTESKYVFIKEGLEYLMGKKPGTIQILEIGFGTGLNALLTLEIAENKLRSIIYHGVDHKQLSLQIISNLNYADFVGLEKSRGYFESIHSQEWGLESPVTDHFTLLKTKISFQELPVDKGLYDLVYYDAFAPSKQPEVWDFQILKQVQSAMRKESALVTYCAQGSFKRSLMELGFEIHELPGPPGKREMVRAINP